MRYEDLHQFIISEIKNQIHDEILWRLWGTPLSDDEILSEALHGYGYNDIQSLRTKDIVDNYCLPADYTLNSESIEAVKAFTTNDNLTVLAPLVAEFSNLTIKKLNDELLQEQATWTRKTDFDRLFLAAENLRNQGILFHYYDEIKGGNSSLEAAKLTQDGKDIKGYFYSYDQYLETQVPNSLLLRNRFLSKFFSEYVLESECHFPGLGLTCRSFKADIEAHKITTIIAETLNKYQLNATIPYDDPLVYVTSFDWKLRRAVQPYSTEQKNE